MESVFLSTPSARRATPTQRIEYIGLNKFLSTPSARRATPEPCKVVIYALIFLSTPSARRATERRRRDHRHQPISIHALREEGDFFWTTCPTSSQYFYPRPPRGGRPFPGGYRSPPGRFLSTPSARRATEQDRIRVWSMDISIHALREEGDPTPTSASSAGSNHFYPRPPRGGRPI